MTNMEEIDEFPVAYIEALIAVVDAIRKPIIYWNEEIAAMKEDGISEGNCCVEVFACDLAPVIDALNALDIKREEPRTRIEFLESTFGNDAGDFVSILEETEGEVYYNDGFGRYCYLEKSEEGKVYRYTAG